MRETITAKGAQDTDTGAFSFVPQNVLSLPHICLGPIYGRVICTRNRNTKGLVMLLLPQCLSGVSSTAFFFFFFFFFLGPHLWHMEVPRLEAELSHSCWPTPQPQQCQIQAASVTYTAVAATTDP